MTARNCCASSMHNNLLSLPDFPRLMAMVLHRHDATPLWDMEYKASGNFRRAKDSM